MKGYIKPETVKFRLSTESIIAMSRFDDKEADPDSPILGREDNVYQLDKPISKNIWDEVW